MTAKARAALATDITTKLADNSAGDISEQDVREVATDLKDSATFPEDGLAGLTGLQAALDLKAPLASPALTGTPTVPTASPGTNTTQAASTAFVEAAVGAAGGVLNNYTATTAPTVNDDSSAGYGVGSEWVDTVTDQAYKCTDASVGAAVWQPTNFTATGGSSITATTFTDADGLVVTQGAEGVRRVPLSGTPDGTKFLRDDGTFVAPAGGGNVSKVGTPVANRVGYWTGDGTLGHEAGFEYDEATDTLSVPKITIGGSTFDGTDQLSAPGTTSHFGYSTTVGKMAFFTPFEDITILVPGMASVALTDGATITPDFGAARNFHVTLGGNRTLANPSGQVAGQSGRILVTQDGTGSRTLSYGANWRFFGSAVLTTTAGAVDLILYDVHASGTIYASLIKNAVIP